MHISKCEFHSVNCTVLHSVFFTFSFFILQCAFVTPSGAVPQTSEVRVADVTSSSFSLIWMTDGAADISAEIYTDRSLSQRVTEGIVITPMPAGSAAVAAAARDKGIMKARVTGLKPATTYYARTVTRDPAHSDSIGYSALQELTTSSAVALYHAVNGVKTVFSNDLVAFPVYIRPIETGAVAVLGDLMIVDVQGSAYPVSAFVGDGAVSPEGIVDLNNLFGGDGVSLSVAGGERIVIRIYRGGGLSTLTHYRRVPPGSSLVSVLTSLKGFFADINLDRTVDDQDFTEFRGHYRTGVNDPAYNPDYNFSDDFAGIVDIREFGKFSKEYGRTDVQ
jgi:hypothetical protein